MQEGRKERKKVMVFWFIGILGGLCTYWINEGKNLGGVCIIVKSTARF
jgi:lipid-A-disaccharide synthase-like uncharacterized protein